MQTLSTISPLQLFREIFPSIRLTAYDDELNYRFRSADFGKICEKHAQKVILKKKLPLTAELKIWEKRGVVFEICLVVKEVPEQDVIERAAYDPFDIYPALGKIL